MTDSIKRNLKDVIEDVKRQIEFCPNGGVPKCDSCYSMDYMVKRIEEAIK